MQQMSFYCRSYCLLNMFQAPLCPSSGAREYYTSGCCLSYLVLCFQVVGIVCGCGLCVRFAGLAFYFHILSTMHSQNHIKFKMNLFKNHTIIVLSACVGTVIMEEQYRPLSLDGQTAVTAEYCALLACYAASSGNFLLISVRNYHYTLYNDLEEHSSRVLHGRSVKSRSS
jgi:hypothetical protein